MKKSGRKKSFPHDRFAKRFCSDVAMMRSILECTAPPQILGELNLNDMELYRGSYVTEGYAVREDDVVWRIRTKNNKWCYLYLIVEAQSKPDRWMPVRIMVYIGLLWQALIKAKTVTGKDKLPPVIPLVLYNGKADWQYAHDVASLLPQLPEALRYLQPQATYLFVPENRLLEQDMVDINTLAGTLFHFDHGQDLESIKDSIARTRALVKGNPALDKTFCDYIRYSVFGRLNLTDSVPEFQDLEEAETMLAENMTNYRKALIQEGKKEGMLEQAVETARKMLQAGKLSLAEIASFFPILSEDDIKKLRSEMPA